MGSFVFCSVLLLHVIWQILTDNLLEMVMRWPWEGKAHYCKTSHDIERSVLEHLIVKALTILKAALNNTLPGFAATLKIAAVLLLEILWCILINKI